MHKSYTVVIHSKVFNNQTRSPEITGKYAEIQNSI